MRKEFATLSVDGWATWLVNETLLGRGVPFVEENGLGNNIDARSFWSTVRNDLPEVSFRG